MLIDPSEKAEFHQDRLDLRVPRGFSTECVNAFLNTVSPALTLTTLLFPSGAVEV